MATWLNHITSLNQADVLTDAMQTPCVSVGTFMLFIKVLPNTTMFRCIDSTQILRSRLENGHHSACVCASLPVDTCAPLSDFSPDANIMAAHVSGKVVESTLFPVRFLNASCAFPITRTCVPIERLLILSLLLVTIDRHGHLVDRTSISTTRGAGISVPFQFI